jgi:hypothetical protein
MFDSYSKATLVESTRSEHFYDHIALLMAILRQCDSPQIYIAVFSYMV